LKCPLVKGGRRGIIMENLYLFYNKELRGKARKLRKEMTPAERKLWYDCLSNFPLPVLRQKPILNYIADFYCSKLRLIIEVDGETHGTKEARSYDERRTKALESKGLKVIRFTNYEVLKNFEGVRIKIWEELPKEFREK